MRRIFRIFCTGLVISFMGAIPLGMLNVAAMQLAVTDGIMPAIYFSLGALIVEMMYVRLSLLGMDWVRHHKPLLRWMEWLTLLIITAMAIASFAAAANPHGGTNVILTATMPRFLVGMTMSALNPLQIPFWYGWTTVLFSRKILQPRNDLYNSYITGIGTGTLIGHLLFIFGGRLVVDRLNASQRYINWFIGAIFALTALVQFWKMVRRKDAVTNL